MSLRAVNLIAPLVALTTCGAVFGQDVTVVKIGHVAPTSGPQAHWGKDTENGVRMAIDDLNAQNILIAGKRIQLQLVAEDDGADPKQATAVAQKLCDSKVAGVVGHLNSGTTIPATRVYNDCGLPNITGAASNPDVTKQGYKTTFRLIANDNALGASLAVYAAEQLKLKKVAVIDDRTAYGQGVAEIFRSTATKRGVTIVDRQFTTDKATDFMAILTSIKSKGADGIFFGGMDAQAGPMVRQIDQLGLVNVRFLGGDGICTNELSKLAGGVRALGHVVCAEGGSPIDRMPQGAGWKARYDAKYPGQFQAYSPYTYDATFVLVDAMKRANSVDPEEYVKALPRTDFQGITAHIQFEPNGELKNAASTLYEYKDGKKIPLR